MATNGVHFMKFQLEEKLCIEELDEIIFDEDNIDDDKFVLNDCSKDILDAYYVSYYNCKEVIYNEQMDSIEEIVVKKNIVIPFSIDLKNNILEIWSNSLNAKKLILKLGIILNQKVIIEPIGINLKKILNKIDKNVNIKITNVKIENYIIENDIVANCVFDLKNHSNPINILKKYIENLVKLTLIITNDKENITMIIYKNGNVVVYKTREEISLENLEIIKNICIR